MRNRRSMARRERWILPLVLLIFGAAVPGWSQVTFNTALPVAEGRVILRLQSRFLRFQMEETGRTLEVLAFPWVAAWGASSRLAVIGVFPYVMKWSHAPETPAQSASGLSDLTLIARYTAFHRDRPGQTIRLAPLLSLRVPAGSSTRADARGRLPLYLQPGSGAWTPGVGVTFTWQRLSGQLDAALEWFSPMTRHGLRLGRQLQWDLGYRRRIFPRQLSAGVPGFLYLAVESNFHVLGARHEDGTAIPGTQRTVWLVSPGIQYVTRRWVVEAAVQIPAFQDVGRRAFRVRPSWILSFRWIV